MKTVPPGELWEQKRPFLLMDLLIRLRAWKRWDLRGFTSAGTGQAPGGKGSSTPVLRSAALDWSLSSVSAQ